MASEGSGVIIAGIIGAIATISAAIISANITSQGLKPEIQSAYQQGYDEAQRRAVESINSAHDEGYAQGLKDGQNLSLDPSKNNNDNKPSPIPSQNEQNNSSEPSQQEVKLTALQYLSAYDGNGFNYVAEGRDNTDTFRGDCLIARLWHGNYDNTYRDYLLDNNYKKMSGTIFLDFGDRNTSQIVKFKVWGDGKLLYESEQITKSVLPFEFSVNLAGVKIMKMGMELQTLGAFISVGLSDTMLFK